MTKINMRVFSFLKSKKDKQLDSNEHNNENELNLFQENLSSPEFLKKVKSLSDIIKKFQRGMNLLHFAAEHGELKLAPELIELGINVDEKNALENTPLWTAVFNAKGNYELVYLLLEYGANPDSLNNADNTPLKFAETIRDKKLIEKLKKHSINNGFTH